MTVFLVLAVVGLILLVGSLVFDGMFDGILESGGIVSLPAIAAFCTAFGATGALVLRSTHLGMAVASGAGLAAGLGLGWLVGALAKRLMRTRTDATPNSNDLYGLSGVVVTAIQPGGYGEVTVQLAGQPVKLNARADAPVDTGATVMVVNTISPTAVWVVAV